MDELSQELNKDYLLAELRHWFSDCGNKQAYNQIKALIQSQPKEISMKDINGWADEIRERVTNHGDWGYAADTIKDMVEEEFGIKVKK